MLPTFIQKFIADCEVCDFVDPLIVTLSIDDSCYRINLGDKVNCSIITSPGKELTLKGNGQIFSSVFTGLDTLQAAVLRKDIIYNGPSSELLRFSVIVFKYVSRNDLAAA